MSLYKRFFSDIDHLNPYLADAKQTSEGLNRSKPVGGVVVAQTSADRVDVVDRLSVRFTRKADFAITCVARKRSEKARRQIRRLYGVRAFMSAFERGPGETLRAHGMAPYR
jgi:hypothetical protein